MLYWVIDNKMYVKFYSTKIQEAIDYALNKHQLKVVNSLGDYHA